MDPPPVPSSSGRFRLRVQIYPPHEAHNLSAAPLRQFTIVKTPALNLPDLTLQELCEEVVNRFKVIYRGESLFAIDKSQDSYGSDLYFGDRVRDVFEDNEIFRVIKGATIRASVDPHQARSQSVQPSGVFQYGSAGVAKRTNGHLEAEESLPSQKRQRVVTNDPDRPVRSRERNTLERELQPLEEHTQEATVIHDSQGETTEGKMGKSVNMLSQDGTKYARINSGQARGSGSIDPRHHNPFTTSSASHQRIPTPSSVTSSKDKSASSDSDVRLSHPRAMSRSKRKLSLIEDSSEQDRGHSISTAVTTPQSVLQQSTHQSPMVDNKKLRRPTVRLGRNSAEDLPMTKTLPRQNVYEVIETDTESLTVKPVLHDVSSKIRNSFKWKVYRSSATPGSDKSSPRQRRNAVAKDEDVRIPEVMTLNHEDEHQKLELERNRVATHAKDNAEQERSRLAFKAAEQRRLDAENREKELEAKIESELVAVKILQKDAEAKRALVEERAEAEATMKKDALARAEASRAVQMAEKARFESESNARLEDRRKAVLDEEERVKEATESEKLRLEMNALRKSEEDNDLKEQALRQSREENRQKSRDLKASLEATVRRAANTPATAAHDGNSTAEAMPHSSEGLAAITGSFTSSNKRVSCTPFIPRGRPSASGPAISHQPQITADSFPKASSPNVGLEDQMPMPPQLKRKVSFADQVPPSGRRSSSTSSALKQSTLVPPRLSVTDAKSTAKRTPLKTNETGPKSSKGKAKVVESPGDAPTPIIEISSGEESAPISSRSMFRRNSFKESGEPGPAYHKSAAEKILGLLKPQAATDVIELDGKAEHHDSVKERATEKIDQENSNSLRKSPTNHARSTSQNNQNYSTPRPPASRGHLSNSATAILPNTKAPLSRDGSLTQFKIHPEAVKTPQSDRSKQAESGRLETKPPSSVADDSEDELDSIETPDALKAADVTSSVSGSQDDAVRLREDQSEATDGEVTDGEVIDGEVTDGEGIDGEVTGGEVEEEADSNKPSDARQLSSVQVLIKNQQDSQTNRETGIEEETADEETEEESVNRDADLQDDSTDEGLEAYSDTTQAQINDQLLSQSFDSSSSFKQLLMAPKSDKILPPATKDARLLENQGSGRPSLRRMNLEAQRTKEANLEAAKARGLEKARKMRPGSGPAGLLEETSEDASSSESSSSSEPESDEDKAAVNSISNRIRPGTAENYIGDLNNEDVEEMSKRIRARSGGHIGPSSSSAPALKSSPKGSDLMFQTPLRLQQSWDKKDSKKSAKIGWAKLGKQFSASKHKSSF